MWIDNAIYFRSDRNGEFNIFSCDLKSKGLRQLTHHGDFPVLYASSGGGQIIYEQAGYLYVLDPKKATSLDRDRLPHAQDSFPEHNSESCAGTMADLRMFLLGGNSFI
jgi:tricorn protease-like protein